MTTIDFVARLRVAVLAVCASAVLGSAPAVAQAPATATASATPQIQRKSYDFKDANRTEQEYALFVPSNYDKSKPTPLIVALHGLGGNPRQILGTRGFTDLAEKHGYIVVAPYGYNERGWYGAFGPTGRGGRGANTAGAGANGAAAPTAAAPAAGAATTPAPAEGAAASATQPPANGAAAPTGRGRLGRGGGGGRRGGGLGGGGAADPPNLGELSEKDVFNVLEIVKKDFNIDPRRTYLMGHSMGGGGTLYLGTKHPEHWAALAPFAPAIWSSPDVLSQAKTIPVIVVQGDRDALVNVAGTRRWVEKLKELNMKHEYIEVAGGDHMSVVAPNLTKMFDFFNSNTKAEAK